MVKKCAWCKENAVTGRSLCAKHAITAKERAALIKCQRLSKGLCQYCGKYPHIDGLHYCVTCQDHHSKVHRARNRKLAEAGICVACGQSPQYKWTLCKACAEKISKAQANLMKKRAAAGLCLKCGASCLPYRRCAPCRAKMVAYMQNVKMRKPC